MSNTLKKKEYEMKYRHYKNRYPSKKLGFSLIEMAIVLMVLGLLTGLTLKGYTLLENAKLRSLEHQINQYRGAYFQFMEKYNALPGDFRMASLVIDPSLPNGDGDGEISGEGLDAYSDAGKFWLHLAASGLIGDVGTPEGDTLGFSRGAPAGAFQGGITVETNPDGLKGRWFIMGRLNGKRATGGMLTPQQALQIMQKNDSVNPYHGRIRARDGDHYANECVRDGALYLKGEKPACVLYFQI